MPKDKMLSDPMLPRGRNLDQESTVILLDPLLPQRENKKPRQSQMRSQTMQYCRPVNNAYHGDRLLTQGMQERMAILP
jgi:hypothetical protein